MEEKVNKIDKKEWIRALKFLLISLSAGVIRIASYTLLFEVAHLEHWIAYGISLVLSVVWNFTINRKYTFKSANNVPIAMLKVACFYLVFTPLSLWWNKALTDLGWNNYLLEVGTMAINFVTEFLYQRFFVFKNTLDTNDLAKKEETKENTEE
ncbi:MAG: GtrA family protein [Clostridia bacterium]|nr:GtrA family protein [Clostridia bacterium]